MKALLIYWLFGCAIVGLSWGARMQDCPREELSSSDAVMNAAVWPAFLFATFTMPRNIPKSPCKII